MRAIRLEFALTNGGAERKRGRPKVSVCLAMSMDDEECIYYST